MPTDTATVPLTDGDGTPAPVGSTVVAGLGRRARVYHIDWLETKRDGKVIRRVPLRVHLSGPMPPWWLSAQAFRGSQWRVES